MNKLLFAAAAALALALAQAAQATPISVGGVTWDPQYSLDFASASLVLHQRWTPENAVSGYGIISTMNGYGQNQFCPGCELTVVFSGFGIETGSGGVGVNTYGGGVMNIYRNTGASTINPADPTSVRPDNTGLGELWLSLKGHVYQDATMVSTVISTFPINASGLGQFDVVGGAAAAFFDTSGQIDGADIAFSSSFTQMVGEGHIVGTGNLFGRTAAAAVPEPGSIALVGAGLVGMTGLARRRRARKDASR